MPDTTITIALTKAELASLSTRVAQIKQLRERRKLPVHRVDNILIRLDEAAKETSR